MNAISSGHIDPPRIERGSLLLIAGLHAHFNCDQSAGGIPALWQRFGPYIGHVNGQRGNTAYGVCYNTDDSGNMDYLCGVEVGDFSDMPPEFTCLRLAEQNYAVFEHGEHIASIRNTWSAIWNHWLPQSQHVVADAPFFERYGESFDAHSGNGGVELWVPLAR